MVKDYHCLGHVQQILAFCVAWFIGIYHYYYGIIIHQFLRLCTVDKHGRLIIRIIHISCHQRPDRGCRIIYHNIDCFSQGSSCTVNTDGCTQGIHIRDLMSHYYHTFLGAHKFFQRLGLYPCFYTGGLLHLLGLAAVVGNVVAVFDNNLVTAASQSHLYGNSGIFIILQIIRSIQANTDT